MALGLVAIISFDAVDLFFVSRLGESHLAAMSFCFPVIWLLTSFNIGLEAGAASTISRAVGARDMQSARRLSTDTALLAGLSSASLGVLGLATIPVVFPLLGAEVALMPLINDYMSIWYWALPASSMTWVCLAAMRARGNTLLEGKIIALAAALNLVLDPILIFGLFGFPRLEMAGAALATLISNLSVLIGTLLYLHFKLSVMASLFVPLRVILTSWRRVLIIGLPAMLTNTIVPLSNGVIVAMVATFGAAAVAGLGIAMRVEPVALIAFYALSAVTSPIMGQNAGAGQVPRLHEARFWLGRVSVLLGLALALILFMTAPLITSVFTDVSETREVSTSYLRIMSLGYAGYGMVMCACAAFNGMGRPRPAVILSALRALLLLLPLALLGQWLIGLPGLFAGAALSNVLIGLLGYYWLGRVIRQQSST